MKKMVLTGIREMEMREVPDPKIERPGDVLLRMDAVGICGSDVHYYKTGRIGSQVVSYPFTVGHECAATVLEIGSEVTHVKPGDRVAIEPAMTCGKCDQCLSGRENTCRNNRFLGCPGQAEGSLCELLIMPEHCLFPVRAQTSAGVATISEPLAIGVYALRQSIPIAGARIGILGMGPIGWSIMLPAIAGGAAAVYCTECVPERVELARRGGATWVGNPDHEDVVAKILEQEPLGLDCVYECVGHQAAIDDAVNLLKPGGKLMIVGIPETERLSFNVDRMRRWELTIQNVRRQRDCVQPALDLIENGEIDVEQMITHRYPFAESKAAFDLVTDYKDGALKVMIEF